MSREHCRKYPTYNKYDNDRNNRLALSMEMHSWYDDLMFAVPVMNISIENVSEFRDKGKGGRYKVDVLIRAIDEKYELISMRLKEGLDVLEGGLAMRTFVYIQDLKMFRECIDWKRQDIDRKWKDYYVMTPAVD